MSEAQWVAMGYIRGPVGVKGWVKVSPHTEYADSLLDYPIWQLNGASTLDLSSYQLEEGKLTATGLQAKFQGIDTRDAAQSLQGATIYINRQDFAKPDEDEYYWTDLIGLEVLTPGQRRLGIVRELLQTGVHDILVIDGQPDILIPFISQYIMDVDLAKRQIVAAWEADY